MTQDRSYELHGELVARGTPVWVTPSGSQTAFRGVLYSVDYVAGVPFTVDVWTGSMHRQVYAARVSTVDPRKARRATRREIRRARAAR